MVWRLRIEILTGILVGNAMAFAGIPNAKDRGDVIAYIKEQK